MEKLFAVICTKCQQDKTPDSFSKGRKACKVCRRAYNKQLRLDNIDVRRAKDKGKRQQERYRLRMRAYAKVWRSDPFRKLQQRVRKQSSRRHGLASAHPCIDCLSEGKTFQATQWDHWDGYDKPEAVWHVEPVCGSHNSRRSLAARAAAAAKVA